MRTAFFIGLFFFTFWSLEVSAQTVLPNAILDTMIFEIKQGRQCNEVMKAQSEEIKALGFELLQTTKALELRGEENKTLSGLLANARDYSGILTQQFTLDKKKLKDKIKRLWIWVIGEGVAILVMVILI